MIIKKGPLQNKGPKVNEFAAPGQRELLDDDELSSALRSELDNSVLQRKKRIISAKAHIRARVVLCAALTDDDIAGLHNTALGLFKTMVLRIRITTVGAVSLTFFMSKKLKINSVEKHL